MSRKSNAKETLATIGAGALFTGLIGGLAYLEGSRQEDLKEKFCRDHGIPFNHQVSRELSELAKELNK